MSRSLNPEDINLKEAIARRILELREATGKNQTQFAYFSGIDKQALNRSEKGHRGISIYTIQRFCDALDISLVDFFNSPLFSKQKK